VIAIIVAPIVSMVIPSIIVIPVIATAMIMIMVSAVPFSVFPVRSAAAQQEQAGKGQGHHYCAFHMSILKVGEVKGFQPWKILHGVETLSMTIQ